MYVINGLFGDCAILDSLERAQTLTQNLHYPMKCFMKPHIHLFENNQRSLNQRIGWNFFFSWYHDNTTRIKTAIAKYEIHWKKNIYVNQFSRTMILPITPWVTIGWFNDVFCTNNLRYAIFVLLCDNSILNQYILPTVQIVSRYSDGAIRWRKITSMSLKKWCQQYFRKSLGSWLVPQSCSTVLK